VDEGFHLKRGSSPAKKVPTIRPRAGYTVRQGTVLSHLAMADVPGFFTYDPPVASKLGIMTIHMKFTPEDIEKYAKTSSIAWIFVTSLNYR
jgi:hypothetical protein